MTEPNVELDQKAFDEIMKDYVFGLSEDERRHSNRGRCCGCKAGDYDEKESLGGTFVRCTNPDSEYYKQQRYRADGCGEFVRDMGSISEVIPK
ncbi:MAG: hypothetical protein DHS20C02_07770 [Micavibrio sp.]|nr:MAG: hypothetical protein DHS20C02_07770 [Micavibrio sp.]